jgi:cellulose synthase (UDP-forming)
MHGDMLSGPDTPIDTFKLPEARKPDDAPRWAQTGQLISLGDYATADELQSDGASPLNVPFRLPPDIYYSERPNALLRLSYRYNSIPIGPTSSMQVRVNNAFLAAVPLKPGQEPSRNLQADVAVPVVDLHAFSNMLSFDFAFQSARKSDCEQSPPANTQGSILRDSTSTCAAIRTTRRCPTLRPLPTPVSPSRASPTWPRPPLCCPPSRPRRRSKPSSR